MKIIPIIIFTLFIPISAWADVKTDSNNHLEHYQHSELANNILSKIQLNKGKKWIMDNHTRSSFSEMAEYFFNIDLKLMASMDLKKVGATLQLQSNDLIQGCTMTGDAHDQLHEFLMGYLPVIQRLSESGNMQDAVTVGYFLRGYNIYFK